MQDNRLKENYDFGTAFDITKGETKNCQGVTKMSRIKYAKTKSKKSSFFAIIPQGNTLIEVLTSPKKVVDVLRKNSLDVKKNYKINNN